MGQQDTQTGNSELKSVWWWQGLEPSKLTAKEAYKVLDNLYHYVTEMLPEILKGFER